MRTRRLIVQAPEGERELLFVGRLTVGRAPECDISVADTKISRRHAEFDATGAVPRVADLGSRNGILVNGRKVAGADLSTGDVVTVGDLRIRYEEAISAPPPSRMTSTDDRTAVLPLPAAVPSAPTPGIPVPVAEATPPPDPAPVSDDRTTVLPRPPGASAPPAAARPAPPMADDDRTAVIPRPPRATPVAAGVVETSSPVAARMDAVAVPGFEPEPVRTSAPRAAVPVAAAPVVVPPAAPAGTTPEKAAIPPPAVAAGAAAAAPAAKGPRFSWGGLIVLVCVALAGLGVLLGALPVMSASSTTIDQLSRRQVRTLGGWVASAVRPDGSVDERVLEDVLSQPGVESAMVLDVATSRVMAPSRLLGRTFGTLPVVGAQWRALSSPTVTVSTGYVDAFVPVAGGTGGSLAWVRYAPPSAGESGVAVIVGLASTLVLALLTAMIIRRHTAATLQHFTRQVELVVSGANPKVMDGRLLPGVDRLPGVVTYLLEQRRAAALGGPPAAAVAAAPAHPAAPGQGVPAFEVAAPVPAGPAWVEVTPSLSVVAVSAQPPEGGVRDWASAAGRHLLDVLEPGPVCNAVVQGLGALGQAAGAEVTVPVPGLPAVTIRREPSSHVRVELAMR